MLAALLTTLLFATSAICGYRTAKQVGGMEANFWRITLAAIFLTIWAFTFGRQFAGAPGWFMLSGFFGIGLGDSAYFQALPRLGSRRTVLLSQCLTAPLAALLEWAWLGTRLNLAQVVWVAVILAGVAIALAPDDHLKISPRDWKIGLGASVLGAIGGALGAVVIRKGYAAMAAAGLSVDAGTTGYQRVLGGMVVPTVAMLAFKWRSARAQGPMFADQDLADFAGKMAAHVALGAGQRPRRPDAGRDLHAVGAQNHAGRHRRRHHRHLAHPAAAHDAPGGGRKNRPAFAPRRAHCGRRRDWVDICALNSSSHPHAHPQNQIRQGNHCQGNDCQGNFAEKKFLVFIPLTLIPLTEFYA